MSEWIKQHPIRSAISAFVLFIIWRLPEWLGQVWPLLTNKTIPEWLAEKRWPGMSPSVFMWFTVIATILMVILFIVICFLAYKPKDEGHHLRPEAPPLLKAPYLTLERIGITIRYTGIGESAKFITLQMFNGLHHSNPKAKEATGIIAELTYYDIHWQRLFGPMRGCWISEKSTHSSSALYLDADPVTLKGQESKPLAIAISFAEGKSLFALSKESLPFHLWKNPASALAAKYYLRISLKGDTVQQILYCRIHHPSDSLTDFEAVCSVQPPEGMR